MREWNWQESDLRSTHYECVALPGDSPMNAYRFGRHVIYIHFSMPMNYLPIGIPSCNHSPHEHIKPANFALSWLGVHFFHCLSQL